MITPEHLRHLENDSAISRSVIDQRGYQSLSNPRGLPPIYRKQTIPMPCLVIPIRDTMGEVRTYTIRPDYPEPDPVTGKLVKYINPAGGEVCLDVPTAALPYLRDAEADLWITEGAKKVDSAVSNGIPATIGLLGVSMWQRDGMALPDWKDVALKNRRVIVCFDSDVTTNPKVRRQLDQLSGFLRYRGANVGYCILPDWEGQP